MVLCQCISAKVVLKLRRKHNADYMSEANAEIKAKHINNERKRVTKKRRYLTALTRIREIHPLARLVQNAGA